MGGEVCKTKGKERGPWYEVKTVYDVIISMEKQGNNASFERGLLKAWKHNPSYKKYCTEVLSKLSPLS